MSAPIVTITLNPCIDKSVTVDRVVPERKLLARGLHHDPGGGGINVARVVHRLGAAVQALWSRGGATGAHLADLLDAEQLSHSPVEIENSIRENLTVFDESSGEQYRFGMPGPSLSEREQQRWLDRVQRLAPDTPYVVVSGSLPGSSPITWFEQLLRALPSEPRLVVDSKDEALRRALQVGVFLIKPNVQELQALAGRELRGDKQIEKAAQELIGRGAVKVVVVSLGRAGSHLITADATWHVSAPPVPPRSKVGAGDSMVGGLITSLAQGRSLEDAIKIGVAAGTAAVITEGTELCRREDLDKLLGGVRSQRLS